MFYKPYLKKRGAPLCDWGILDTPGLKRFQSIIVIPSYNESKYIIKTLESINNQSGFELSNLLVIVVVNNSLDDRIEILKDNFETIKAIGNYSSDFKLLCIDASSPKHALSKKKSGVGYARKIGMDCALQYSAEKTILHCLDADTIVSRDYLRLIANEYRKNDIKALIVDFEHQQDSVSVLNKNIRRYEEFLKLTALKIHKTGSPYGYVALGPTITCLAITYVSIGGMVSNKATEDFYFLQKIRKYSDINFLNEKIVFPSSRASDRVYLGTGFRMNQSLSGSDVDDLYYSERSFEILSFLLRSIKESYKVNSLDMCRIFKKIDIKLNEFLDKEGFFDIWDKINNESKTLKQFELQFHKWFDNLKTLRLLRFYS